VLLKCVPEDTVVQCKISIAAALEQHGIERGVQPRAFDAPAAPLDADMLLLKRNRDTQQQMNPRNPMSRYLVEGEDPDMRILYLHVHWADLDTLDLPEVDVSRPMMGPRETYTFEPNATPDPTPNETEETEETGNEPPTTERDSDMVESRVEVVEVVAEEEDSEPDPDAEGIKDFLAVFTS
jgi:hypothetical protein